MQSLPTCELRGQRQHAVASPARLDIVGVLSLFPQDWSRSYMSCIPADGNTACEITDEELERVMREKLGVNEPRLVNVFTEDERRIADRFLGKAESDRLQRRRNNARPFKPRKPVVTAEYYEVPPLDALCSNFGGGWRVDVRHNGEIHSSREGMERDECAQLVSNLSRRGVIIKPIVTEWMRHNPGQTKSPQVARRKPFTERYGNLPVGRVG